MSSQVHITLTWDKAKLATINARAIDGLLNMGYDIARVSRPHAPYKTGALRNSIRVRETSKNTVEVVAGGRSGSKVIPYGAIHEWGGWTGRGYRTFIRGKHYMEIGKIFVVSGNYLQKYFGGII